MRFVSAILDGESVAAELIGDEVVPIIGLSEIGPASTIDLLRTAPRDAARATAISGVELRPLVPAARRILCVGLNYRSHIDETKRDDSDYPVLFSKFASALLPPDGVIELPPESTQVDYEGELAVIIGRPGRRIPESRAADHILGYAAANDVTMRDFQYRTHQWLQGKTWDRSTPLGPAVVTADELDADSAGIRTVLNGVEVQASDLAKLIFSIPTLISTISAFTSLEPGDIILTGTPGGVGFRRDPQLFLHDGDVVVVEVEGLGGIANRAAA